MSSADMAKLALAEALGKRLAALTSTKGGPRGAANLRTDADAELMELYEMTGSDRIRIDVNGVEVGTLSLAFTKPAEGTEPVIDDYEEFAQWVRTADGGMDTIRRLIAAKPDLVLEKAVADGELPDGCRMRKVCEPKRVKGTTLRVRPADVARAYGEALPSAVAGMLGKGDE